MTVFIIYITCMPRSSDTLSGTCLGLSSIFKPRKAEDALFCFVNRKIKIDFLVRTCPYTSPVTPALFKVNKDYAVLFPLAYGFSRTCSETRRVGAVVTQPGKIEIKIIGVVTTADIFIPSRSPGRRFFSFQYLVFAFHKLFVIKLPRLSIIFDRR